MSGGLGGGAYGATGNIWHQLSGKTNSSAKTPELGKLSDIHATLGDLLKVWQGAGAAGGATVTGQ